MIYRDKHGTERRITRPPTLRRIEVTLEGDDVGSDIALLYDATEDPGDPREFAESVADPDVYAAAMAAMATEAKRYADMPRPPTPTSRVVPLTHESVKAMGWPNRSSN